MNKKISKILGVGLTVALLASLLTMAAPASALPLAWYYDSSVNNLATKVGNIIAPAGTDIVDLAVNGSTIYAATGASAGDNITWKSTDGGATWSSLFYTTYYPGKAVNKVAVAADDANTVIMLTADYTVYYSSNGGSSWTNLGIPTGAAVIKDIDVSSGTAKYIAAGGRSTAGAAELYILYVAMAQAWAARYDTAAGAKTSQTDIFAVKLSPNYTADNIITVVSGNTTDNITYFQAFRNTTGARTWNNQIAFFSTSATEWATGIQLFTSATTGLSTLVGGIAAVDIALVPTYLGTSETERIVFVAAAGTTSGGGVTRLSDTYPTTVTTWTGAGLGRIGSLAYHASGKLLAGDYDDNQVYRFLTPMGSTVKAERVDVLKQPGGVDKVQVAWSGDNAVAGTSGGESAFALSTDSGASFNDTSLIDTALTNITDVALSADASKVYLTTNDGTDTSVWVKGTAWTRVLSLEGNAAKHLVRVAPEDAAAVYVARQGTTSMWVSKNSGASWTAIPDYNLTAGIQDFVVESASVVYAIDTAGVSKTSDSGSTWGSRKTPTDAFTAYMVTLATNSAGGKDVLIGGSGYVAYSKDAGATLTRTQATTVAGNVQVVADKDYATNNVIYGGVATTVQRGKADATTAFSAKGPTFDAAYTSPVIKGIAESGGIVYVLSSNTTDSVIHRALNLTPTVASGTAALWSSISTGYELEATPQALKLTTGPVLWAIDTANTLTSFSDPLAVQAPTLKAPATDYEVAVNETTGRAYNVTFIWDRPAGDTLGYTTAFQLQIATDTDFNGLVYDYTFTAITETTTARAVGPTGTTNQVVEFMPGTIYYWRLRVSSTGPMYSLWSETRTLKVAKTTPATTTITVTAPPVTVTTPPVTVEAPKVTVEAAKPVAAVIPFGIVRPAIGETVSIEPVLSWTAFEGAIGYEVMVSTDSKFAIIDYSHNVAKDTTFYKSEPLSYGTTYYWRVRGVTGPAPAKQAAPGGAWATGIFATEAKPVPPAKVEPTVIVQKEPAPPAEIVKVPVTTVVPQPIPNYLLWVIIVVGAVLIIALIVLIARTRRVT